MALNSSKQYNSFVDTDNDYNRDSGFVNTNKPAPNIRFFSSAFF